MSWIVTQKKNGHMEDICEDEIELCIKNILTTKSNIGYIVDKSRGTYVMTSINKETSL